MKSYVLKCVECISFLVQHSQNQFILKKNLNCSLTTIMYASLQSSLLVPCYIYGTLPANKWNRLKTNCRNVSHAACVLLCMKEDNEAIIH